MVFKKIGIALVLFIVSLQAKPLSFSVFKKRVFSSDKHLQAIETGLIFEGVDEYQKIIKQDLEEAHWVTKKPSLDFFLFQQFYPFAQKKIVVPQTEAFIFGDIHGDVQSLIKSLDALHKEGYFDDNFKIKKPCYFIFLGDYVDRGTDGIEVLYALLRLKCENPTAVVLLRGNHEDKAMNRANGFKEEIKDKYGSLAPYVFKRLHSFYQTLPSALLWESGNNALLCFHGGIELGVDLFPLLSCDEHHCYQLITEVDRRKGVSSNPIVQDLIQRECEPSYLEPFKTPLDSVSSHILGFLWNDFSIYNEEPLLFELRRGLTCGAELVENYLEQLNKGHKKVKTIVRGHQHGGDMYAPLVESGGIVAMYDDTVYTLLGSSEFLNPDDKEEHFASFMRVVTAPLFDDWDFLQWSECLSEPPPSLISRIASYFYAQTLGRVSKLLGR